MMERWLLMSNCQTFGLVNAMRMMCPAIEVIGIDTGEYRSRTAEIDASLGEYDRVVVNHEVVTTANADHSRARKISDLPALSFAAYHPDLTYIFHGGTPVSGPNNHYHSMLGFAAYMKGLSVNDAERAFNGAMYERCGYFERWAPERDALLETFAGAGMDLSAYFLGWGREAAFMYSTNHPAIRVVYDLARAFLEKEGYATRHSGILPHDNLVQGPCFPVYPEIAENLGASGSYLFKRISDYRQLDLKEFLEGSFATFDGYDWGTLEVESSMMELFTQISGQF